MRENIQIEKHDLKEFHSLIYKKAALFYRGYSKAAVLY